MDISDWLALSALMVSGWTVWIARHKAPHEERQLDSEAGASDGAAANSFAEAARTYAQQVCDLQKSMDTLKAEYERRFTEQEIQLTKMRQELIGLQVQNKALIDWADRLCHQIISLGGTPVELKTTASFFTQE